MNAQDFQMPKSSPTAKVHQDFSTSFIEYEYSRPSAKGRAIFGDLVPYDQVWRTGANASTKVTFGEDVNIEGQDIKAGTYSLYAVPNKDYWEIIFNSNVENWGTTGYKESEDVMQLKVKTENVPFEIETFTIDIDNITSNSCVLSLMWADVYVPINIKTDNRDRILKYLDKELQGEKPPYYQAASYYFDQNYELGKANTYVDKAIAENPKAFYMYWLKARILAKLDNKTAALSAAAKAADLAKGSAYENEYSNHYNTLKDQLK